MHRVDKKVARFYNFHPSIVFHYKSKPRNNNCKGNAVINFGSFGHSTAMIYWAYRINQVSSVMQQATPGHTKTYIKLQCDGKRRCFLLYFKINERLMVFSFTVLFLINHVIQKSPQTLLGDNLASNTIDLITKKYLFLSIYYPMGFTPCP